MKMIKYIPFFRTCNRQIDYIDKSYCSLTTVPEDIMRFSKTLEELNLNSNHIRELPSSFYRLTRLRKLSLYDNDIAFLSKDIGNLINLVELDVSKNECIETVPDTIENCEQLQLVDFSTTSVTDITPITRLQNLTTLYLNFNSIKNLPKDFGSLSNLKNLELRDNLISELPDSFRYLQKLVRLDLGNNEFRNKLPEIIGELINLEELWLDKNEFNELPKAIGDLRKLQSLDITENSLEDLPEEIKTLESLIDLHLSKNEIKKLPDGIGYLKSLTILKLDENLLSTLNPFIGGCSNLQELMLTDNKLTELPPTIGNLVNLEILNLDLNKLTKLPSEICNLTKLGIISLRSNYLTHLPNEMGQLKKLHVLDVANNQLQYLPYSITSLNLEALWLSENQSHPLLKFQTDQDPNTGQKVLTCFLLPQQLENGQFENRNIEKLLDSTLQRINSIDWEKPKQSTVKFFYDNELEANELDELLTNTQSFVRHDTPHPKELKARHRNLFAKDGSALPVTDNNEQYQTEINQDTSNEPNSTTMQIASNKSESESSEASSVIIRQSYEQNSNLIANKTSTVQNLSEIDVSNQDMLDNYLDDVQSNIAHQQQQQYDLYHQYDDEQYQTEMNQDDYTMEGSKHVLFPDNGYNDVNNDETDEQQVFYDQPQQNKLHRRDTPHWRKNKCINSMTNKADADKVASILDKLNNQMNYDANEDHAIKTSSSSSVNNNELTNNFNDVNNLDFQNNYQQPIFEPCEIKQLRFHLTRSPQYGLGLSIAGGKGSTPYKNNDESIFVSNVAEKSPAFLAGLQKGDKILSVNDISLEGAEHFRAVKVFKMAGEQFSVLISREVPISMYTSSNTNLATTTASNQFVPAYTSNLSTLTSNGGIRNLGFDDRLSTNTNSLTNNNISVKPANTTGLLNNEKESEIKYYTLIRNSNDIGITIAYDSLNNICIDSVLKSSPGDKKVRKNDKLVSINGKDIKKLNMAIEEVQAILNSGERFIRIVVERN